MRRLNQGVQFIVLMGNSGDAFVWLDANQHGSAVGIGQGRKARTISRARSSSRFFCAGPAVIEGADELQKLPAFLFEQESDFVCWHAGSVK